jgi:hypothetical protein
MGGYGSGRRWDSRKVEDRLAVDIRELRKAGHLGRPGSTATWGLYSGFGNLLASVRLVFEEDRVWFGYRSRDRCSDGTSQERRRAADIDRTSCTLGGTRPWFICPNWRCSRRVTTLYVEAGELGCRHCLDLAYESQSETVADRARRRERKIRRKLGMGPNLVTPLADKPKWMRWRTYFKLRDAARLCARISTEDFARRIPRLRGRLVG